MPYQSMRKFLKNVKRKIIPALIILAGAVLVAYPWISEYVYQHNVGTLVEVYQDDTASLTEAEKEQVLADAIAYNEALLESNIVLTDPFSLEDAAGTEYNYESTLNYNGNGIMAFIDIPEIDVYLPIYHGTSDTVLEKGVGHLENTSLPVGGESTHCVLSGHTGLNSARLFTDLTALDEGDLFFIDVLDETLAYEVVEIQVVEPDDVSSLSIQEGRDLVTLVTCTPYGINSHRLLVTGERTEYSEEAYDSIEESGGTQWMQAYRNAILAGIAIVAAIAILMKVVRTVRRKAGKGGGSR